MSFAGGDAPRLQTSLGGFTRAIVEIPLWQIVTENDERLCGRLYARAVDQVNQAVVDHCEQASAKNEPIELAD